MRMQLHGHQQFEAFAKVQDDRPWCSSGVDLDSASFYGRLHFEI
jgi:hypothetical protein